MLTQLNPQLQQRLGLSMPEITTFCQRWRITELSLFGSVLGDRFHSDRNIDILNIVLKKASEDSENWIRHLASPIFGRSPPSTHKKDTRFWNNWYSSDMGDRSLSEMTPHNETVV